MLDRRRFHGRRLALAGILSLAIAPIACASDLDRWHVEGLLLGKKGNASTDISGIACIDTNSFPRNCLVIDDNLQSAQQVTLTEGKIRAGSSVPVISERFEGKPLELDGEGVAYANRVFYVIGSHGHPRDRKQELDPTRDRDQIAARITAASQIVRLRSLTGGSLEVLPPSRKLASIIDAQPDLRPFAKRRLEANGVTIEGVAVSGDRLFVGFRGPSLPGGQAPVLSVALAGLFGDDPDQARLFRLPVGAGRGVRDLAAFRDRILVLIGPTGDGEGSYTVHSWDGRSNALRQLADLNARIPDMAKKKPEAILPLDANAAGLRILVLFDGGDQGTPTELTIGSPDTKQNDA